MIINSTPQNEAILSNVGEVGEFRIRNSAKAFNILSSGLYANKIRAVIRELSCNAVDSHVAAGKGSVPFDVHLPNQLEPWFSVRDYGLGLSHDDVQNIYTTYFESTKTDSNAFIGGLGLGSKSPFAYTDNFTVTATLNGYKGIFTAFINDVGVPSIALMEMAETTDPNGVEVKFSVNNASDFQKFRSEATQVFKYFALRPVISGASNFKFEEVTYREKDIIPGIHYLDANKSVAVMGNVPYPIDVPNSDTTLGTLKPLLACGLEINFAIGELDFQASREGLSYNKQTIDAIKDKLTALNAILTSKLAADADAILNLWTRGTFLEDKYALDLWKSAVVQYINDTKFPLFRTSNYGIQYNVSKFEVKALAKSHNIKIDGFWMYRNQVTSKKIKNTVEYDRTDPNNVILLQFNQITPSKTTRIVVTDTKTGALQRAKAHWRNRRDKLKYSEAVYVLSPVDKSKPMDVANFYKMIYEPPMGEHWRLASTLDHQPKQTYARGSTASGPVEVLTLQEKHNGRRYRYNTEYVWRPYGVVDLSDTTTKYYVEIIGHQAYNLNGHEFDVPDLLQRMARSSLPGLSNVKDNVKVYGIRKSKLAEIKGLKNWINLENMIPEALKVVPEEFWITAAHSELDRYSFIRYNSTIVDHITNKESTFIKVFNHFQGKIGKKIDYNENAVRDLYLRFLPNVTVPLDAIKTSMAVECGKVIKKYPLLKHVEVNAGVVGSTMIAIAEYINLIDSKKESVQNGI